MKLIDAIKARHAAAKTAAGKGGRTARDTNDETNNKTKDHPAASMDLIKIALQEAAL